MAVPFYDRLKDLSREQALSGRTFVASKTRPGWYDFSVPGFDTDRLTGWKFHISVDALDMARAVDIMLDVAETYYLGCFKVADHKFARSQSSEDNPQAGKSIVLYDSGNENWAQILQKIEDRFENANPPIEPIRLENGQRVAVFPDRPVDGSNYAYYRNDGDYKGGAYIGAAEIHAKNLAESIRYNPNGLNDPFSKLQLTNPHFDRPRKPRDHSALLAEHFSKRKHLPLVFEIEAKYLIDAEGLQEKLTASGIGNRKVWGAKDPNTRFFEVDCPLEEMESQFSRFLKQYLLPQGPRDEWLCKRDVACLAALAPKEGSLEELALMRALEDESITFRRYFSENLKCKIIEVNRIGKPDPQQPDDLAKLGAIINVHATNSQTRVPARPITNSSAKNGGSSAAITFP